MDENLIKIRHERSKKDFPWLRLGETEYVEFAFQRAKVCLWLIFGGVGLGLIVILFAFLLVLLEQSVLDEMGKNFLFIILFALLAAAVIIGLVALRIYRGNRLFITNQRVIQMSRISLVSNSVNIIDLQSIEDASFRQESILQKIFKYGTFRLSTIGDETTYTFPFSDIKPSELEAVSKLISHKKAQRKKKPSTASADASSEADS